ncbi:hypothetical protein NECAME_09909 [Necator americanus]|uniref:Uncharacterized protein n=1 Tax=Necator americanus TaxID=51031 RepID=W2TE88_NECAM|nr:hypothetical protein NECAME_09909 [Necator americanus]ETN79307.1 hypothetical protein NECAME_09909 [Necator americanus]
MSFESCRSRRSRRRNIQKSICVSRPPLICNYYGEFCSAKSAQPPGTETFSHQYIRCDYDNICLTKSFYLQEIMTLMPHIFYSPYTLSLAKKLLSLFPR